MQADPTRQTDTGESGGRRSAAGPGPMRPGSPGSGAQRPGSLRPELQRASERLRRLALRQARDPALSRLAAPAAILALLRRGAAGKER